MTAILLSIFLVVFGLLTVTILWQFLLNYQIVGANRVAIVAGKGAKGYKIYQGGRVVTWPLLNKRYDLDLRPITVRVTVERAIAEGMVPLNVEATITFAISSTGEVLDNAVQRLLHLAQDEEALRETVADIVEGHIRDGISTMAPEAVMRDKDMLVKRMLTHCREDLQALGLEITTVNVSDLEDHRLEGMENPELYIELLNRVEATNAEAQARSSQAQAHADAGEKQEENRAILEERRAANQIEAVQARTLAEVAEQERHQAVGVEEAERSAQAEAAGVTARIEAEKQRCEEVKASLEAEVVQPANAERDRQVADAHRDAANIRAGDLERIVALSRLGKGLEEGGKEALNAYLIGRLQDFTGPMTRMLGLFPAKETTIISGKGEHSPLSATTPNPVGRAISEAKAAAFTASGRPGTADGANSAADFSGTGDAAEGS